MGLDSKSCRPLLLVKRDRADFSRTLCLGRANLRSSQTVTKRVPLEFGRFGGEAQIQRVFFDSGGGEPFLKALGARLTDSVDASDYGGATHTFDLNQGLPESMQGQYDAVIDGGTLEHVFNFPTALREAMEAVKEGGRLYIMTQCNNAMGHGLYQFSPELYYRVFSPENGFAVEHMFIAEGSFGKVPWHSVADPKEVRRRVEMVNDVQTYLLVTARRVASVPIFTSWPQQSDYSLAWQDRAPDANFKAVVEAKFDLRDHLPPPLKRLVRLARLFLRPRSAPPCYQPVEPATSARKPLPGLP